MRILLTISFLLATLPAFSQNDSTRQINFSGFIDAYYAYDLDQPQTHERPNFLYNHNRHNEFNINLALLKAAYATSKVRGNLGLMAGTYAQYNLAAEQQMLKNIYEANVGIRLTEKIWVDAGIFPSHIGLEGAISKDNFTLTRSLAAENSPYYESGVKLTYEPNPKWIFSGLVLNGWQNIREPEGNSNKAIGTQIQFKPNAALLLNSSSFIGNEKPDTLRQMRYFHDFYATLQINPKIKAAAVFDIGAEKRAKSEKYNIWYTPALFLHYQMTDKIALAARTEYYQDKHGVIISSSMPYGFRTSGYSLNLDYVPEKNVMVRVEGRLLNSKDAFLSRLKQSTEHNAAITSSLAISF